MPFIHDILKYDSLSIVGLEKNTGKTECLNYILKRLPPNIRPAVTSIGIDGEERDQVTRTAKPEIILREGVIFSTAEAYYRGRKLSSELLDITEENSSMGRIVTGRVIREGKIMLAGPSSTQSLKRWMSNIGRYGVDLKIIDGALNRLSLASPALSSSMILSTGAAFSAEMNTLVNKTKYVVELISADVAPEEIRDGFDGLENGIWGKTEEGEVINITRKSSLILKEIKEDFLKKCRIIYVAGALTDTFLGILSNSPNLRGMTLVVDDFTKVFVSETSMRLFKRMGGRFEVLRKSKLIAVCVNPTAPNGYVLDSDILCGKLEEAIGLPVYDIVKNDYLK